LTLHKVTGHVKKNTNARTVDAGLMAIQHLTLVILVQHGVHWSLLWSQTSANLQKFKQLLKMLGVTLDCQFKLSHQHMTTLQKCEFIALARHHLVRDLVARLQGWK
jgi:hypothetical protein